MSHTSKGEANIKDESAIVATVAELNAKGIKCRLERNHIPRMYSTARADGTGRNQLKEAGYDKTHADLCLVLEDGRYDVALMREADGSYCPVFDSWANHVGKQIGANRAGIPQGAMNGQPGDIGLFMQTYAKHAAINAATQAGHMVTGTSVDPQGNVHVEISC